MGVTIPAVVFTDPEVAWCGLTEAEAKAKGIPVQVSKFPWAASGRALSFDRPEGLTKLIIDPDTERVLGVGHCRAGGGRIDCRGRARRGNGRDGEGPCPGSPSAPHFVRDDHGSRRSVLRPRHTHDGAQEGGVSLSAGPIRALGILGLELPSRRNTIGLGPVLTAGANGSGRSVAW